VKRRGPLHVGHQSETDGPEEQMERKREKARKEGALNSEADPSCSSPLAEGP
jgi:hypothetical protein